MEIKLTKELIDSLDLYSSNPQLRAELAHKCMYSGGGEMQALYTTWECFRYSLGISYEDILKFFASRLQMEFNSLKDGYLSYPERNMYLYDNTMTGWQVAVDKNNKLFTCYYDNAVKKFYVSQQKKKEVHPAAIFRHINNFPLVELINKQK